MQSKYTHIFEQLTIKHMTLKNRIVMTPMGTNYGEQNGEMSFLHINYYEQRAKGGTGLLIVENASVDSPEGSNGTTQLRIDHGSYIPRLFKLCETIHKHGACIAIQINHAGASAQSARTNMQPVSASNIPSKAGGEIPRPLEKEEILRIVKNMGRQLRERVLPKWSLRKCVRRLNRSSQFLSESVQMNYCFKKSVGVIAGTMEPAKSLIFLVRM